MVCRKTRAFSKFLMILVPLISSCGGDLDSKTKGNVKTVAVGKNTNKGKKQPEKKDSQQTSLTPNDMEQKARAERRKQGAGLSADELKAEREYAILCGFTEEQVDSIDKRVELKEDFEKEARIFGRAVKKAKRTHGGEDESLVTPEQKVNDGNEDVLSLYTLEDSLPFNPLILPIRTRLVSKQRAYTDYVKSLAESNTPRRIPLTRGSYLYQGKEFPLRTRPWDK